MFIILLYTSVDEGDVIELVLDVRPNEEEQEGIFSLVQIPIKLIPFINTKYQYIEEFLIKWKGQSHLHNTWELYSHTKTLKGARKVDNFHTKYLQELQYRSDPQTTKEELEQLDIRKEMDRITRDEYTTVERVISLRNADDGTLEYFCKWKGLNYSECTWEPTMLIQESHQAEIDALLERNGNPKIPSRSAKSKDSHFEVFKTQPAYIPGELRDYQLLGVNWMAYLWHKGDNGILADEMVIEFFDY